MNVGAAVQNLIYGLFAGGDYGLAAVGLTLIFGVMRILNVAHGDLLMLGGYVTFGLFSAFSVDPFVSILASGLVLFLIGLALNLVLFRFVERLEGELRTKNSMLVSFGLALVIQNVVLLLFKADDRSVNVSYAGGVLRVLGVVLPLTRLYTLLVGAAVVGAFYVILQRTDFGRAVRATALDWEAASLAGINVRWIYLLTFAIGSLLAGVAGSLVVIGYSVSPSLGLDWTLRALVVLVLAGLGNVAGAFAAGLLLGLVESLSTLVIGPEYREVIGLVLFVLVLLVRPQGLFGRRV